MHFLKLIRFPNLILIALTQYLVRYTIIIPILAVYDYTSILSDANFFLTVLSTVLIAAGGYIINDYYDLPIDQINKPNKIIIDTFISKSTSLNYYFILTLSGIVIGIYLSFFQNVFLIWQFTIVSAVLLFFYSTVLKKIILIGNLVIAFLSALAIYLLLIVEKDIWISFLQHRENAIESIPYLISAYAVFAFVISLIREIIKDMEDENGDEKFNRKTIPVVFGTFVSKIIICSCILFVLSSLIFIQYKQQQWHDKISFNYVVIAIEFPLLVLIFLTIRAKEIKQFSRMSLFTKGIMLTGILSMLVFYLRYK